MGVASITSGGERIERKDPRTGEPNASLGRKNRIKIADLSQPQWLWTGRVSVVRPNPYDNVSPSNNYPGCALFTRHPKHVILFRPERTHLKHSARAEGGEVQPPQQSCFWSRARAGVS